jgi:fatty-acid desaturase
VAAIALGDPVPPDRSWSWLV